MAIVDYTSILGKRVKITQRSNIDGIDDLVSTGVFVGYNTIFPTFAKFFDVNEILFLEDGFDKPDFVHFDELELIG